jgi:hypothetical protein
VITTGRSPVRRAWKRTVAVERASTRTYRVCRAPAAVMTTSSPPGTAPRLVTVAVTVTMSPLSTTAGASSAVTFGAGRS